MFPLLKKELYADQDLDSWWIRMVITTIIQIAFCGDHCCQFVLLVLEINLTVVQTTCTTELTEQFMFFGLQVKIKRQGILAG